MVVQCSSDDVVADEKMLVHSRLQQKLHCTGARYVDMSAPRQRSRDMSQVSRQIRRYPWAHLARPGLLGCGRPNKLHDPLWRRCIQPACTQFWHHIPMDEPRERTVKRVDLRFTSASKIIPTNFQTVFAEHPWQTCSETSMKYQIPPHTSGRCDFLIESTLLVV